MQVKIASSDEELKMISPVMLQLRSQYDEESLIKQIKQQQHDGYYGVTVKTFHTCLFEIENGPDP